MLTFTFAEDESGDVGFSFGDGSSHYFVVAMIATTAPERLREVLEVVRKESKLPAKYEFKFQSLSSTRLRRRVFHAFSQADFSIWAVMTDKTHLPDTFRLMSDLDFFSYFVSELIGKVPRNVREGGTFIMTSLARLQGSRWNCAMFSRCAESPRVSIECSSAARAGKR